MVLYFVGNGSGLGVWFAIYNIIYNVHVDVMNVYTLV